MIIFQWSIKLSPGAPGRSGKRINCWLNEQFASLGWPPARTYSCLGDESQFTVEIDFYCLPSFESAWGQFAAADIAGRLARELGVSVEPDSECRQLFSTQYVRSPVDGD